MTNGFSIKESVSFGWTTFKAHWVLFLKVSLAYLAVQFVLGMVQSMLPPFFAPLLGVVVGTFLSVGIIAFYLKAHDAPGSASIRDMWRPEPFWRYLVTSIIMGILIIIGFFLLIVPGIILALAWSFALYLTIEKKMWVKEALLESARLTRGNRLKLLILGLALMVLNVVGMIPLFLGLFVTVPVSLLASVHVYRTLSNASHTPSAEPVAEKVEEAPAPAPVA